MTFQLITLIIPAVMAIAWLIGSFSLSRGGDRVVEFTSKALLVFSVALGSMLLVLEQTSLTPRWIAGGEGYGVIIPVFSIVAALGLGLVAIVLNAFVLRKITSKNTGAHV